MSAAGGAAAGGGGAVADGAGAPGVDGGGVAAPAGGGVAGAADAGAPAGGVATRVHTCGVLPITATARSIIPPRPSKLIVSPSRSATRKLVGDVATSVIVTPPPPGGVNVSCSPLNATVMAAPASSLR